MCVCVSCVHAGNLNGSIRTSEAMQTFYYEMYCSAAEYEILSGQRYRERERENRNSEERKMRPKKRKRRAEIKS